MSVDERQMQLHLAKLFDGLEGFLALAVGFGGHFNGSDTYDFKSFSQDFFSWPEQADTIVEKAIEYAPQADVYICALLRTERSRKQGTGGLGRCAWADLDAEPAKGWSRMLLGPRSFVVGSGYGMHPYLWLPEPLPATEIERLNRRLARTLGADAGWSETKYLRLAGTLNHKGRARGGESAPVRFSTGERAERDLTLADLDTLLLDDPEERHVALLLEGDEPDAQELRRRMPRSVLARLDEAPNEDRSAQAFAFVAACRAAGCSYAEVQVLARSHRPTQEKYGARAEREIDRLLYRRTSPRRRTIGRRWRTLPPGPTLWTRPPTTGSRASMSARSSHTPRRTRPPCSGRRSSPSATSPGGALTSASRRTSTSATSLSRSSAKPPTRARVCRGRGRAACSKRPTRRRRHASSPASPPAKG
jgi:hypothetical protein